MSEDAETNASSSVPPPASKSVREWVDVSAKLIGAVAIAGVTWVGYNYQSKASLSSVINQREQAESQLRASMLSDLVEPITGRNGAASEDADLERQRLLAEMVTLNFHDHFEFKPLLQEVDTRLLAAGDKGLAGHDKISSAARRVVDRQINMLTSIDGISRNGDADGYRAKVITIKLVDQKAWKIPDPTSQGNCTREGDILARLPSKLEPTTTCISSPDDKVCLIIDFFDPDYVNKLIVMSPFVHHNDSPRHPRHPLFWPWADRTAAGRPADCNPSAIEALKQKSQRMDEARISLFDFPLTDNSKIMWQGNEYRYSVSLYQLSDVELTLKVVWFPEGYVTERERPINQVQVARFRRSR
jgi:hypothetical protein